jgi:hypothetical protein
MKSFHQIAGSVPFSHFQKGGGKQTRKKKKRTSRKSSKKRTVRRSIKRVPRNSRKKPTQRIKRRSTRKDNRRSKRKQRTPSKIMKGNCNCDKKKKYTGKEPSPEGLGYCPECVPLDVTMKGNDGNLWKTHEGTNGKEWIMVRNDMAGGK